MTDGLFGAALTRLWPNGDAKVAGLLAGIIASAPSVLQNTASPRRSWWRMWLLRRA